MQVINEWQLKQLREEYPVGTRVELIHMDDPYNCKLIPGCQGTVRWVDDMVQSTSAGIVVPASVSSPAKTNSRKSE